MAFSLPACKQPVLGNPSIQNFARKTLFSGALALCPLMTLARLACVCDVDADFVDSAAAAAATRVNTGTFPPSAQRRHRASILFILKRRPRRFVNDSTHAHIVCENVTYSSRTRASFILDMRARVSWKPPPL